MKRFIFSVCLFAFAAPPAAAWSHWKAFRPVLPYGEKPFIIHRLAGPLKKSEITFCLEGSLKRKDSQYYSAMVKKSLRRWFTATASHIRQSGRAQEFASVLHILENAPAAAQIPCPSAKAAAQPDLRIFIGSRADIQKKVPGLSHGAFKWDRSILYLDTTFFEEEKFERTMTHEFGHALGLADRYTPAASADSSAFYSTPIFYPAMMSTAYNIECDDAEGLINLLDRIVPSERSRRGWNTICKEESQDRLFYKNGKPDPVLLFPDKKWIGAASHQMDGKTRYFTWDPNSLPEKGTFLYVKPGFADIKTNDRGLPAVSSCKNGTYAFYFYGKESISVLLSPANCKHDMPFEENLTACAITPEEKIMLQKDEEHKNVFHLRKTRPELIEEYQNSSNRRIHNYYTEAVIRFQNTGRLEVSVSNSYLKRDTQMHFTTSPAGQVIYESIEGTHRKRSKNGTWGPVTAPKTKDALQAATLFENARAQICGDDCQAEIIHVTAAARRHWRTPR